eukprot:4357867-Alexandrium_andersonii.AAC.1
MLVHTLVCARHARVAQSSEQAFDPGAALLRASGAGRRAPLPYSAALQAPGRVAVLLKHGLGDVDPPRSTLSPGARERCNSLLRDVRGHLWQASVRRRRLGPPHPGDRR